MSFLSVSLTASSAPGCGDCEEPSCDDSLTVLFERKSEWEAGTYEIDLDLDGRNVHCTFESNRVEECDDEETIASIEGVSHTGSPDNVELTIRFDGAFLGSATLEPKYEKQGDRRCGPRCDNAHSTIELP